MAIEPPIAPSFGFRPATWFSNETKRLRSKRMLRRLQAVFPTPELSIETAAFLADKRPDKIFIVDDEYFSRDLIRYELNGIYSDIEDFDSADAFLNAYEPYPAACLILDLHMCGTDGLALLKILSSHEHLLPVIVVSGSSGISDVLQSIKGGAIDFIQKPIPAEALLKSVAIALSRSRSANAFRISRKAALDHLASLTPRQRQIMSLVLLGSPSKNIAADLGVSQRTVESHRAEIMQRMGANSVPELCEMTLAAIWRPSDEIKFQVDAD